VYMAMMHHDYKMVVDKVPEGGYPGLAWGKKGNVLVQVKWRKWFTHEDLSCVVLMSFTRNELRKHRPREFLYTNVIVMMIRQVTTYHLDN
jgi:hypothetical protein